MCCDGQAEVDVVGDQDDGAVASEVARKRPLDKVCCSMEVDRGKSTWGQSKSEMVERMTYGSSRRMTYRARKSAHGNITGTWHIPLRENTTHEREQSERAGLQKA